MRENHNAFYYALLFCAISCISPNITINFVWTDYSAKIIRLSRIDIIY